MSALKKLNHDANLLKILALELREEFFQAFIISIDANRTEDSFDIAGRRRGIASKPKEKVSCEMLHFR